MTFVSIPPTLWLTGRTLHRSNASTPVQPRSYPRTTPLCVLDTKPAVSPQNPPEPANKNDVPSPATDQAWESLKQLIPFKTLRTINKTGQYLGNEFGAVRKPWDSVDIRFCLAYPDLYSIGMSSTGHVVLYSCLNDDPRVLCDRAYLPAPDMQAALQTHNTPLFAVESHRPLHNFDVIGMSLSYELGATNCLKVLELAGLPYTWAERDSGATLLDGPPLVFAGGLTVTANPEPYSDFFDFFSIGDGEEMLPEIGRALATLRASNPTVSREDALLHLAQTVPGVYVPRFYTRLPDGAVRPNRPDVPLKVQKRNSLPEVWRATALVPVSDPVHDRLTVEIRRGCTRGCRFCLPGMVQRPARDVPPEEVVQAVKQGVKDTGYNEFSLLSLSCSDWLSLPSVGIQLKNELKKEQESISLSLGSQRVDRFNEDIANVVSGVRRSGLTFAPEAGTQRMRDVINKGLTNEELARGVKVAYDAGYQNVKLYFMINLPSETDEDVMGIAETISWLQRICRAPGRRRISVTVTISTFTPKPWTPFQWHSSAIEDVKRKQLMLKKALRTSKDVKFSMTDPMLSLMEDFIGRGDRRLGPVMLRAHELGAGMDAWWESMDTAYNAWCQAIREAGLEWQYRKTENGEWNIADTEAEEVKGPRGWYNQIKENNLDRKNLLPKQDANSPIATEQTATQQSEESSPSSSPLDRPLPWDHIDTGLSKGWLRDELMNALTETLTPDCAFHECSSCGVCGDDLGNNITIPPPEVPAYEGVYHPSKEAVQRFRVAFKKTGSIALASHLDMNRMFDRLIRKASIPISFTGGFHPHPRIINAAALPFGATSDEELVDFILREHMFEEDFRKCFDAHLPEGLDVVWCEMIAVKAPNASAHMESADYVIALERDDDRETDWEGIVKKVMDSGPIEVEKVSKRGAKNTRNLRAMLFEMRIASHEEAAPVLNHVGVSNWPSNSGILVCNVQLNNEGGLGPEGVVNMINLVMETDEFELLHAHRKRIRLRDIEDPPLDVRMESRTNELPEVLVHELAT